MGSVTILSTLFLILLFGGVFICVVFTPYVLKHLRSKNYSEAFWLAAAISLSWGGLSLNRMYVLVALEGDHFGWDTGWLRNHWLQIPTLIPTLAGMLIFMRVASYTYFGEHLWLGAACLILILSIMLTSAPQIIAACF